LSIQNDHQKEIFVMEQIGTPQEVLEDVKIKEGRVHAFLERGGSLGWGIVPTLDRDAAAAETLPSLLARFDEGVERLTRKGFERELLLRRALITPSCGAGGVLTEPLAERVLGLLRQLSAALRGELIS
jgi:hypothetical protein